MRETFYDGQSFKTLNVIDEGNRKALRIECGSSIPAAKLVRTRNQLSEVYGKPYAIRMENGPDDSDELAEMKAPYLLEYDDCQKMWIAARQVIKSNYSSTPTSQKVFNLYRIIMR